MFMAGLDVTIDDTEQAYVLLGTPGLSMRDDRRYAFSVLDTILGGGMSSRLFQTVREQRALAYEIGTFQQGYREAGLFGVTAGHLVLGEPLTLAFAAAVALVAGGLVLVNRGR